MIFFGSKILGPYSAYIRIRQEGLWGGAGANADVPCADQRRKRQVRLNLGEMAAAGYISRLATVAPEVRFVTPALHDCKGFMTYVFKVIDKPTTTLLLSVAPSSFSEKNFTGDQVRTVAQRMAEKASQGALTGEVTPWLFYSLSELCHFRCANIPWRYWHKGEQEQCLPLFIRARVAAHMFEWCMEKLKEGITANAYCHSLHHWWDKNDAVPLNCKKMMTQKSKENLTLTFEEIFFCEVVQKSTCLRKMGWA